MKALRQIYGIFRKEFSLQSRNKLTILNRLLIGPIISSISAGVLYAGFFRVNQNMSLGSINARNYTPTLILGFLAHNYLNSGFYFLPTKMMHEWYSRTLPLFWMAPCSRPVIISGMGSVEFLRCQVLTFIGLIALNHVEPLTWRTFLSLIAVFLLLYVFAMSLGAIKCAMLIANEGRGEILDNIYLGFVFTACFYIPKELLPRLLWPICEINPAYHANQSLIGLWSHASGTEIAVKFLFISVVLVTALCHVTWKLCERTVFERSFG